MVVIPFSSKTSRRRGEARQRDADCAEALARAEARIEMLERTLLASMRASAEHFDRAREAEAELVRLKERLAAEHRPPRAVGED